LGVTEVVPVVPFIKTVHKKSAARTLTNDP